MALIVKSGKITDVVQGKWTVARNGNANQMNEWTFRIDGTPVKMRSGSMNSISEGDVMTIVGQLKKGSLEVCALRNDTTGAYDAVGITMRLVMGIAMVALGVPTSLFIVGIPLLYFGIMNLRSAYIGHQAKTMLDATPRSALA